MKKLAALFVLVGLMSLSGFAADTGADIYKSKCQACHGANGTPNPAMAKSMGIKDLKSPDIQSQSADQLKATIEKGKGKMPAFSGKLTPEQTTEVVTYIKSMK